MANVVPLSLDQRKLAELIRFVCGREPDEAELKAADDPDYDYAQFRLRLLLGEECLGRWPSVAGTYRRHLAEEKIHSAEPNQMAHDVSLMRQDLEQLQKKYDRFQPELLALIRQTDDIAKLFETAKQLQTGISGVMTRLDHFEKSLAAYSEGQST